MNKFDLIHLFWPGTTFKVSCLILSAAFISILRSRIFFSNPCINASLIFNGILKDEPVVRTPGITTRKTAFCDL